jgi:Ser/Thr protein kinase RdoA (MazF antagonist)
VEIAALVQKRYDLGPIEVGEPLAGGYANDVLRIEAGGSSYVLRVKHPPVDAGSIAWEHDLLGRLAERLEIVPAPIRTRDGSTFLLHDRFAISLLPLVKGRIAEDQDGRAAAKALGEIHAAGAELSLRQRPAASRLSELEWPPARLPSGLASWLPQLEAGRRWAIEWTSEISATAGLIHADFFPGNLLVDDGRATAVLDWEEARLDWPAIDLAAGVWHFCRHDLEVDDWEARAFVAAYRAAGGVVPPAEDELLIPLIRAKRVLEVLRAPTDRHVDWDYQLSNLRSFETLGRPNTTFADGPR